MDVRRTDIEVENNAQVPSLGPEGEWSHPVKDEDTQGDCCVVGVCEAFMGTSPGEVKMQG